jgi:dTDP-4-amino-4,6-dideoxygalactose transaminase
VSAGGEYVPRFEAALAGYTRAPAVVATSTGTAALHLALRLAGVGPTSVVLAPTLTFVATLNAVSYCGAEPWFVDVDPHTWNVSAETLARALRDARAAGRDPRFVMVTHLYGVPADLDGITALCAREGLTLLEDAAESLGSWWNGRHTGTFGRAAALSFNGNKIVTAGQGGALLLASPDDAARARHLATQARVGRAGVHPRRGGVQTTAWRTSTPRWASRRSSRCPRCGSVDGPCRRAIRSPWRSSIPLRCRESHRVRR